MVSRVHTVLERLLQSLEPMGRRADPVGKAIAQLEKEKLTADLSALKRQRNNLGGD